MINRRELLAGVGAYAVFPRSDRLISNDDLRFLRELAAATLASATKSESKAGLGFAAITPGGAYPSLWIRDFSMATGCGCISLSALHTHLRAIAASQNDHERRLGNRAFIPQYAIPDHINYWGGPVFYPGTYSSGDDQGGEPYGALPPIDDHFEFIHIAHQLWSQTGSRAFLAETINGQNLLSRLRRAFDCPTTDADTGLCMTRPGSRAVGFGFCDGIYLTGKLLFPSILRHRALGELIELYRAARESDPIVSLEAERRKIEHHIIPTFLDRGWLKAATEVGQQPDVWGTAFALYLNVVTGRTRRQLLRTVVQATRGGTITHAGGVRHVPTDADFSKTTAWEQTAGEELNRYQNGAYWHVPTGWLACALAEIDRPLAQRLVRDMIQHFRDEDFRKPGGGAPWECFHPDGRYRQNPVYLASVTLPLECLTRWESGVRN